MLCEHFSLNTSIGERLVREQGPAFVSIAMDASEGQLEASRHMQMDDDAMQHAGQAQSIHDWGTFEEFCPDLHGTLHHTAADTSIVAYVHCSVRCCVAVMAALSWVQSQTA